MKVALIGLGNSAKYWMDAAAAYAGAKIVAGCDINEKTLDSTPINLKFSSMDSMLNSNSLHFDIAAVLTPPENHFETVSLLIERGINVAVEKPISNSFEQVTAMYEQAKIEKVFLSGVYHAANALDLYYFLKNRNELEKDLGKLLAFDCEFYDPYVIDGKLIPQAASLGGSYLDSCVNALSVIQKIIGFDGFRAINFANDFLSFDNWYSQTQYDNGKIKGCIKTSWLENKNYKCTTLLYEKGKIILHHSLQEVIKIKNTSPAPKIVYCGETKPRMLNHYIGVLKNLDIAYKENQNDSLISLSLHSLLLNGYC